MITSPVGGTMLFVLPQRPEVAVWPGSCLCQGTGLPAAPRSCLFLHVAPRAKLRAMFTDHRTYGWRHFYIADCFAGSRGQVVSWKCRCWLLLPKEQRLVRNSAHFQCLPWSPFLTTICLTVQVSLTSEQCPFLRNDGWLGGKSKNKSQCKDAPIFRCIQNVV